MGNEDILKLTPAEAIELLSDEEEIHTFLNPGVGVLVGADWPRSRVVELLETASEIQLTGEQAQKMGHGIAAKRGDEWVFVETRKQKEAHDV